MRKPIIVLLALTLFLLGCGGGKQATVGEGGRQVALGEAFDIPFPSGGERVSVKGTGLSIGVEDMTESLPTQGSSGGGWATTLKISLNGAEQPRQVKQGGTTTVGDYDIKVLEVEPKHVSLRVTRR